MEFKTHSREETLEIGKKIAHELTPGSILLLYGDLGAGKTTLTKGIAEGLGITDEITSPTFTLMNVYSLSSSQPSLRQLVHIDTYRLEDEKELRAIGAEDYIGALDTICIIEWPEKVRGLWINKKHREIFLEHGTTEENRKITLK